MSHNPIYNKQDRQNISSANEHMDLNNFSGHSLPKINLPVSNIIDGALHDHNYNYKIDQVGRFSSNKKFPKVGNLSKTNKDSQILMKTPKVQHYQNIPNLPDRIKSCKIEQCLPSKISSKIGIESSPEVITISDDDDDSWDSENKNPEGNLSNYRKVPCRNKSVPQKAVNSGNSSDCFLMRCKDRKSYNCSSKYCQKMNLNCLPLRSQSENSKCDLIVQPNTSNNPDMSNKSILNSSDVSACVSGSNICSQDIQRSHVKVKQWLNLHQENDIQCDQEFSSSSETNEELEKALNDAFARSKREELFSYASSSTSRSRREEELSNFSNSSSEKFEDMFSLEPHSLSFTNNCELE